MQNNTRVPFFLLCGLSLALALSPRVFGQAVTATIVGQVGDATGGVIPAAKVTITNQQTGVAASVVTNASGNYEFPFALPGIYTVSITHENFKASITKNVNVAVNTTVRVDATLTVGSDA
jgi:hypothetical protein